MFMIVVAVFALVVGFILWLGLGAMAEVFAVPLAAAGVALSFALHHFLPVLLLGAALCYLLKSTRPLVPLCLGWAVLLFVNTLPAAQPKLPAADQVSSITASYAYESLGRQIEVSCTVTDPARIGQILSAIETPVYRRGYKELLAKDYMVDWKLELYDQKDKKRQTLFIVGENAVGVDKLLLDTYYAPKKGAGFDRDRLSRLLFD